MFPQCHIGVSFIQRPHCLPDKSRAVLLGGIAAQAARHEFQDIDFRLADGEAAHPERQLLPFAQTNQYGIRTFVPGQHDYMGSTASGRVTGPQPEKKSRSESRVPGQDFQIVAQGFQSVQIANRPEALGLLFLAPPEMSFETEGNRRDRT